MGNIIAHMWMKSHRTEGEGWNKGKRRMPVEAESRIGLFGTGRKKSDRTGFTDDAIGLRDCHNRPEIFHDTHESFTSSKRRI